MSAYCPKMRHCSQELLKDLTSFDSHAQNSEVLKLDSTDEGTLAGNFSVKELLGKNFG